MERVVHMERGRGKGMERGRGKRFVHMEGGTGKEFDVHWLYAPRQTNQCDS